MLLFEREQQVAEIGNVKMGGQPGENPPVAVATVFYAAHKALLNEKTGKIDKTLVEQEVNDFMSIVDETGMQAIVDVVGGYPEALYKECLYISKIVDCPFLVDGLNDESRVPAMGMLRDAGLLDRAILNSIDENTSDESLEKYKEYGVKNSVLLTFGSKAIFPKHKLDLLKTHLIPSAEKAGIKKVIVDTAVLDLPSIAINFETTRLVKSELGLPTGYAPANAIYGWSFVKKYGDSSRCGAISSIMVNCLDAGADFVLFGPVKFAKCIVPSMALKAGINSYYRKRILRKPISDKTPFKHIF